MSKWKINRSGPNWLMDGVGRLIGYRDSIGGEYQIPQVSGTWGANDEVSDPGSVGLGGGGGNPTAKITGVSAMKMSSAGSGGAAGSYTTIQQSITSNQKFYAVRIRIANWNTAAPLSVTNMKVAPSATLSANGAALTWTQVTWGGSNSASIAAATAGTTNNTLPTFMDSDVIYVTSLDRTDVVGAPYLLYVRTYDPALQTTNGPACQESAATNAWLLDLGYTCRYGGFVGDAVTTTTSGITMGSTFTMSAISEAEFFTGGNAYSLHAFGDSLTAGYSGNASNYVSGWCNRVQAKMRTSGKIGGIANWAVGGMRMDTYVSIMKTACSVNPPDAVYFSPFSPNSGSSQAQFDEQFGRTVEAVAWLLRRGIKVYLSTACPGGNVIDAPTEARRVAFNARLISQFASTCTVWDFSAVISDPAVPGTINPAYIYLTGPHWNDAGDAALATYVAAQLGVA